jgi:hypothetical protein
VADRAAIIKIVPIKITKEIPLLNQLIQGSASPKESHRGNKKSSIIFGILRVYFISKKILKTPASPLFTPGPRLFGGASSLGSTYPYLETRFPGLFASGPRLFAGASSLGSTYPYLETRFSPLFAPGPRLFAGASLF